MNWDEYAATWDEGEAQRAYAEAAFDSLRKAAPGLGVSLTAARICDFGCGTGLLTEKVAPAASRVDAIDRSPAMLDVLRAKIGREGWDHVHPHTTLPTKSGPYDLVLCSSVCAFLDDYPGMVIGLAARLGPGGLFVQWDWELEPESEEPFGLSRDAVRAALQRAGLERVTVDTAFAVAIDDQTMRPLMGVGRKPAS